MNRRGASARKHSLTCLLRVPFGCGEEHGKHFNVCGCSGVNVCLCACVKLWTDWKRSFAFICGFCLGYKWNLRKDDEPSPPVSPIPRNRKMLLVGWMVSKPNQQPAIRQFGCKKHSTEEAILSAILKRELSTQPRIGGFGVLAILARRSTTIFVGAAAGGK